MFIIEMWIMIILCIDVCTARSLRTFGKYMLFIGETKKTTRFRMGYPEAISRKFLAYKKVHDYIFILNAPTHLNCSTSVTDDSILSGVMSE